MYTYNQYNFWFKIQYRIIAERRDVLNIVRHWFYETFSQEQAFLQTLKCNETSQFSFCILYSGHSNICKFNLHFHIIWCLLYFTFISNSN